MRRCSIFLLLLISSIATHAQVNYNVNLIPKQLLPYASAVVRNDEEIIEVKGFDNVIYYGKKAITVLNKNGDAFAHIIMYYDKSSVIKNIKGNIYDEFGKPVSKFSESNFSDVSAGGDESLFDDSRAKHYLPAVVNYPYTIVYEYEIRSKQTLNLGEWKPNPNTALAVEKSSFTFTCKPDFKIRYKEFNSPTKATIQTNKDGEIVYTWQASNIKAVKYEPFSPDESNYLTSVRIAPEKFSYEGLKGSFTNWNELGKWIYDKLLADRDILTSATVDYILKLTKDTPDPKEKARKIYRFMQQKTHYISVQVGIGGYKPFSALEVDKSNYGDCKGLVYYMQALLKVININSYYCVVGAGENKSGIASNFASMEGNHIILCIPFKNDTTWLECTNQQIPFGYLGTFTDDRNVLACTAQGGIILHTPKYPATINLQTRNAQFTINDAGELDGKMETIFKGTQYDNRNNIINKSVTDQIKDLKSIYSINNLDIAKLEVKQDKSIEPSTTETLTINARDYAAIDKEKINFMLNPVNRTTRSPREVRNRANAVYISEGYTDEDEINYIVPKSKRSEKIPLDVSINKPFGSYSAKMTLTDGKLLYKRKIQLLEGTYSKETYQDLVDFYKEVTDADNYTVSLVKN